MELKEYGQGGGIRTHDHSVLNRVLYQTELLPNHVPDSHGT